MEEVGYGESTLYEISSSSLSSTIVDVNLSYGVRLVTQRVGNGSTLKDNSLNVTPKPQYSQMDNT